MSGGGFTGLMMGGGGEDIFPRVITVGPAIELLRLVCDVEFKLLVMLLLLFLSQFKWPGLMTSLAEQPSVVDEDTGVIGLVPRE